MVMIEKQDARNQQTALKDFSIGFQLILSKDTNSTLCNFKTSFNLSVRFLHLS